MTASKFTHVRDNFKNYCDKACNDGEVVIITRKQNKNVVLISEDEFNKMIKKLKKSIEI